MSSGVAVHDDCLSEFQALKIGHKHKYIIYNLSKDNTHIIVDKKSEAAEYDDFLADLPETECRWAIYDFGYERDGGKRNKLIFFSWSPDSAKIKNKMLFASSKDALRRALVGIALEIQATDHSEAAYESVYEKIIRIH